MTRTLFATIVVGAATVLLASCAQAQRDAAAVDRSKILISLERTACYGTCPAYKVTIDGKGHVVFTADAPERAEAGQVMNPMTRYPFVRHPGRHEAQIDPAIVDRLVTRFTDGDFFELKDEYRAPITDNPAYFLKLQMGGRTKQVVDYAGTMVGMPKVVRELEKAVDEAAGTDRWIE